MHFQMFIFNLGLPWSSFVQLIKNLYRGILLHKCFILASAKFGGLLYLPHFVHNISIISIAGIHKDYYA